MFRWAIIGWGLLYLIGASVVLCGPCRRLSGGERFALSTTQQLLEVFYNSATGEREYREVSEQTETSDG